MFTIDGSQGEGGGQVLRTALGLSVVTGTPFVMTNIRAGRRKPGLMRQHLTCVRAAARVGGARVEGDSLRSTHLRFEPTGVHAGCYRFAIGSAGSTTLVFQTVLPALAMADGSSTVEFEGGTHNPMAPPIPFLVRSFLPLMKRMGVRVEVAVERLGFAPGGGGAWTATVHPAKGGLRRLDLLRRGAVSSVRARALVANLPPSIGHREMKRFRDAFDLGGNALAVEEVDAFGPGNVVFLEFETGAGTVVFDGFGSRGRAAEKVADGVIREAKAWLEADVPVEGHLADQLLIPMAMAGGGRFRTVEPSLHTRTNASIVERFLPVTIEFEELAGGAWEVRVGASST
jgi:RNA 3'-terminal phosphate cyclase (ATP)